MTSEYGVVNTGLFTLEASYNPTVNTEIPHVCNMELDNETFTRVVHVSDGMTNAIPRLSETDLQVSRHRISAFLSRHTASELLPQSGKVIALDVELPVEQAFHISYEQLGKHGSNLTKEELDTHTISAWKDGKAYLSTTMDGFPRQLSRHVIHAGPYDNLKDVALRILQNNVATVPIIYSSSEDGSYPQLLHITSLSGILKCICRYFRHCHGSLPILQAKISEIPIGTWVLDIGDTNKCPLAMLRPNASLNSALNLLLQAQVSSIPIVDDNDSLIDIYCRSYWFSPLA